MQKVNSIKDFLIIKPEYIRYGKVHKRMSYKGCRINQSYNEAWEKIWLHYKELIELREINKADKLLTDLLGFDYGKTYLCYSEISDMYYQKSLTKETDIKKLKKWIKKGILFLP